MCAASYRRVLIKLGGEALAGPHGLGIDPDMRVRACRGGGAQHERSKQKTEEMPHGYAILLQNWADNLAAD